MPRTKCPEHGIKRIEMPWSRPGSDFTLLFEQASISLISRQLEASYKRLWRIVHRYVDRMLGELDLTGVTAACVHETASLRGQRHVTVFLDMQQQEPVIFAVPDHGKAIIEAFSTFLAAPQITWPRWSAICLRPF